jgi:P63C domain
MADAPTAAEMGAKGGRARARKLTPEKRQEIARQAAERRWADRPLTDGVLKATHQAPLNIAGITIPVAVLEDGTRVLSTTGFNRSIGRTGKVRHSVSAFSLPPFLTAPNLKPFIPNDLIQDSVPIPFHPKGKGANKVAFGYKADFLPRVCNVFMDAKEANALLGGQTHIWERCRILSRGFATVGITALIDEATGYQEVRDRQALQAILDKFLSNELAAWAKRFPDEFYRQMFRLKQWEWRGMGLKRPRIVGHYTADVVYQRLAPTLLDELQRLNPKDERGHRPAKHHQWLTEDVGHPALAQHLYAVIGLMRLSDTWDEFYRLLQRAYPKRNTTQFLPFTEDTPKKAGEP